MELFHLQTNEETEKCPEKISEQFGKISSYSSAVFFKMNNCNKLYNTHISLLSCLLCEWLIGVYLELQFLFEIRFLTAKLNVQRGLRFCFLYFKLLSRVYEVS